MSDLLEGVSRDSIAAHLHRRLTRASVPWTLILVAILTSLGCTGESGGSRPNPVVLVGIDGASWIAIEDLWQQGRLPNLRALAERGVTTDLQPVADISPVIWTSFVTGVRPERHGITDFLLPTTGGDVPVSSTNRKVPAIWNMLTTLDRRVAVLGWWASWPAEEVNGVVVSDRALKTRTEAIHPPELATRSRPDRERGVHCSLSDQHVEATTWQRASHWSVKQPPATESDVPTISRTATSRTRRSDS